MTTPVAAPPARTLVSLAAVIATAAIFGLTYSLSATLIALDLAERGAPQSGIGLNAAMHALGVLAVRSDRGPRVPQNLLEDVESVPVVFDNDDPYAVELRAHERGCEPRYAPPARRRRSPTNKP